MDHCLQSEDNTRSWPLWSCFASSQCCVASTVDLGQRPMLWRSIAMAWQKYTSDGATDGGASREQHHVQTAIDGHRWFRVGWKGGGARTGPRQATWRPGRDRDGNRTMDGNDQWGRLRLRLPD